MSGLPPPGGAVSGFKGPKSKRGKRDFSPSPWNAYFDAMQDVKTTETNSFRVYLKGTEGAVVLFLHGGGLAALSWAVLSEELIKLCNCRMAAVDLRGHGDTVTDDDYNLSMETMVKDVVAVVEALYGDSPPKIVLMGHSMGGALAVHLAHSGLLLTLAAMVVIDVVEGTALDALSSMQSFLRGQPKSFVSLEAAIEWSCKTGQIRNIESAKVSMPPRFRRSGSEHCSEAGAVAEMRESEQHCTSAPLKSEMANIREEEEERREGASINSSALADRQAMPPPPAGAVQSVKKAPGAYRWRIDLTRTESFWEGWFKGLSTYFLDSRVPSFLLLAGVDRLDKDLTIAQMQGKFQMKVLPQCGHCVHEDAPDKVAEAMATFLLRHELATPTSNYHRPPPGLAFTSMGMMQRRMV